MNKIDEAIQIAISESSATHVGNVGVDSGMIEIGDCGIIQFSIPAVGGDGVYPIWDLGDYLIIEKNMMKIFELDKQVKTDWFWSIIEEIKDEEHPEKALKVELEKLSLKELLDFQQHFDTFHRNAYFWNLWGAARIINKYCSDDGFDYFCSALISLGRSAYENAITDPESLAEIELPKLLSNELFSYVASRVYEEKTGVEMPRKASTSTNGPIYPNWDINNDKECAVRLPKLWKKHRTK
jgi:hypothetical protein